MKLIIRVGRCNLRRADLGWTDLRRTNLGRTNFRWTDFRRANLGRYNFWRSRGRRFHIRASHRRCFFCGFMDRFWCFVMIQQHRSCDLVVRRLRYCNARNFNAAIRAQRAGDDRKLWRDSLGNMRWRDGNHTIGGGQPACCTGGNKGIFNLHRAADRAANLRCRRKASCHRHIGVDLAGDNQCLALVKLS
ncbi:MAG: hypothetical protein B7Z75_02200 [Acidocella sp. 20-57-95]|nr:MAG: hypothetical protein B7Z75_02200 [Acidocella sp. 20-57-95]